MSKRYDRETEIKPYAPPANSDQIYKLSHAPQFKNAKQYVQAKLIMLEKDFHITPTETEIKHLCGLATESEINRAVRQIINNHWK